MPTDRVDYPIVPTQKIRTPTMHHNGRINKVVNRMNITSNPLAGDGEKVSIQFIHMSLVVAPTTPRLV